MDIVINANTNGKGLWSEKQELITCIKLELEYDTRYYSGGSLDIFFITDNWNVKKDGLIYTDPQWIKEFKEGLVRDYNFSEESIDNIGYSEQGRQGIDYINLDVGNTFIKEWRRINGKN